jgi:hypothetical protein
VYDTNTNEFRDACAAAWFEVSGNTVAVPAGSADIGAGASVHGSFDVSFRTAPADQGACRGVGVQVSVDAT